MAITIDNSKVSDKAWGSVSKTELAKKLLDAGSAAAIHETYLFVGKIDERSSWKFPHHNLEGDTLVVNRGGVHAAAQRLVSGGATASDIPDKKAAARHLLKHYKAMDETPPDSLKELAKSVSLEEVEAMVVSTKALLESCEQLGLNTDSLSDTLMELEEEVESLKASRIASTVEQLQQEAEDDEEAVLTGIIKAKGLDISYAGNGLLLKRKSLDLRIASPTSGGEEVEVDKASPRPRKRDMEDYRPSEEDMPAINLITNVDARPKDMYAWECLSADMNVDAHFEHFLALALNDMKEGGFDNPMQLNHTPSVDVTVGKIFSSRVANKKLYEKFFTLDAPEFDGLNRKLAYGLLNKVSVGVLIPYSAYLCDSCKTSIVSKDCPHQPGMVDEKTGKPVTISIGRVARKLETSLVFSPAQFAAGIRRSNSILNSSELGEKSSFGTIPNEQTTNGDETVADEQKPTEASPTTEQVVETAKSEEAPAAVETAQAEAAAGEQVEATKSKADPDVDGDEDGKLEKCMKDVYMSVQDLHKSVKEAHDKLDSHSKKMDEMSEALKSQAEKLEGLKTAATSTQEEMVKSILTSIHEQEQSQVASNKTQEPMTFADRIRQTLNLKGDQ